MAMLAMLWHQQRAILKQLGGNGQRLARIEGYLARGMPPAAATGTAGAFLVSDPASTTSRPSRPDEQD